MNRNIFMNNTIKVAAYLCEKADENNEIKTTMAEIAKDTKVSRPTVTEIINDFISEHTIFEVKEKPFTYYIPLELFEIVAMFYDIEKDIKLIKLDEIIKKNAHEFCENEKKNNTIIGYVLYKLLKSESEKINLKEFYTPIEIYLYLKYECKAVPMYDIIGHYLFNNAAKNIDNYRYFIENTVGPLYTDRPSEEAKEIICRDITKQIFDNLEPIFKFHYLFNLPEESKIDFIILTILIDAYLYEELRFMDDKRYSVFNKTSVIFTDTNEEANKISSRFNELLPVSDFYIHVVENELDFFDIERNRHKKGIRLTEIPKDIYILTYETYSTAPDTMKREFEVLRHPGFYVFNGDYLEKKGPIHSMFKPNDRNKGVNYRLIISVSQYEAIHPIDIKVKGFKNIKVTTNYNQVFTSKTRLFD